MGDTIQLEDIALEFKDGKLNINHPYSKVFTSFDSKYLDSYEGGVIDTRNFDTNESLSGLGKDYVSNYRKFLGSRHVHLGSLDIAGFLNPSYDLTFVFETSKVLSHPHLIVDHDSLFNLLLYNMSVPVDKLYSDSYSKTDEILTRRLDLNDASFVIAYSGKARHKTEKFFDCALNVVDLSVFRNNILELED